MKTFILLYAVGQAVGVIGPYDYSLKQCEQLIAQGQIPECLISKDGSTSCRCEMRLDASTLRESASPS